MVLYGVVGFLGLMAAWFVGRLFDINFRAWVMQRLFKRDIGILAITSKDKKKIDEVICDFQKDLVWVQGNVWIFDKRHLYRKDKVEKGMMVENKILKFKEGVPTLFVDRDSLMPIEFDSESVPVKPNEIAANLKAWIDNERAKLLAQTQGLQTMLLICMLVSMVAAGAGYMAFQKAEATQKDVIMIKEFFGVTNETMASIRPIERPVQQPNQPK